MINLKTLLTNNTAKVCLVRMPNNNTNMVFLEGERFKDSKISKIPRFHDSIRRRIIVIAGLTRNDGTHNDEIL
jgi:hypothetical protein